MLRINKGTTSIPQESQDFSESSEISGKNAAKQTQRPAIDTWETNLDAHGCPACPHPGATGVQDAPNVLVNFQPAIRMKNNNE